MDICVVIGIGPNSVEIPALVFKTWDDAKNYLEDRLGTTIDSSGQINLYLLFKNNEEKLDEWLTGNVFKNIYSGCGGCYALQLKMVNFGEVFVEWDLD